MRGRLRRLRLLYAGLPNYAPAARARGIAYFVIELDNAMTQGMREFVHSSMLAARTCSGHRVKTSRKFASPDEVSAHIFSVVNNPGYVRRGSPPVASRKDEPTFRDPIRLHAVLHACGASNINSVSNAQALNLPVFDEIASVRNFYAHRNEDTFTKVVRLAKNWGLTSLAHCDDLLAVARPSRPVRLFEDWLAEIELYFEELTK